MSRRLHTSALVLIFGAAALWLQACAGAQSPSDTFQRDLDAYHAHLRWGRFDEAVNYLAEDEREEFLGELEQRGDGYQITDFEVKSVTVTEANKEAIVVVWIQSYRLPSTTMRAETTLETWSWDDQLRTWHITDLEKR
ncbi:MAG: hypothetical protein HQ461_11915 [Deltaproteobacteria bacterium]|nr:hypothetical protein [Deltaproteobacteria bacterium]